MAERLFAHEHTMSMEVENSNENKICFKSYFIPRGLEFKYSITCSCYGQQLSQPHFEGSVRSPFTLPKMGLGSLPGLSET